MTCTHVQVGMHAHVLHTIVLKKLSLSKESIPCLYVLSCFVNHDLKLFMTRPICNVHFHLQFRLWLG